MIDYDKLIAECLAILEKPLPAPCNETENCRRAGGCFGCLVFMPLWDSIKPLPYGAIVGPCQSVIPSPKEAVCKWRRYRPQSKQIVSRSDPR